MKVVTWNVNSIAIRLDAVLDWVKKHEPDVLCLQEIKCVDEKFPRMEFMDAGYNATVMGQKSYNGVAILSKHDIDEVQYNFPGDDEEAPKRLIAATIKGVRIVNTYMPNGTELGTDKFTFKLDWFQRLRHYFDDTCKPDSLALLCGDFNVAYDERDVWSVKAWEGKLHFTKTERAALDYIKKWGFVDVFRKFHDEGGIFSWWNYREGAFPKDQGLRIDYIWTSEKLADKATDCYIDREPRAAEKPSDHTPVVAEFKL